MSIKIEPHISIVGAGPGDPELLTIKGLKAIQSADVILYDALSNDLLLAEAPQHCLKIYVGKRANRHRFAQAEINRLMVQYALALGHVVRLKGGDPFVFGRGHEELSYARENGLKVDLVPGVSSCIAVPELQGIPLTRRGINESFWVLTGTTKDGQLSKDIALAIQTSATIVILMGIHKIEQIAGLFCEQGKAKLPVMVVQNGSYSYQKKVIGTAENIAKKVKEQGIGTPGIIVFGAVVGLATENLKLDQVLSVVTSEGTKK